MGGIRHDDEAIIAYPIVAVDLLTIYNTDTDQSRLNGNLVYQLTITRSTLIGSPSSAFV